MGKSKKPFQFQKPAKPAEKPSVTPPVVAPAKSSLPNFDLPLPPEITGEQLHALTGLTDRRHRQLAKEGYFPEPHKGKYPFLNTLRGLFLYFGEQRNKMAQRQLAIAEEDLRKKKRENDLEEKKLIARADVVGQILSLKVPVEKTLTQRLENEYPMAVAGLEVPAARIYGRRVKDEILRQFSEFFGALKL